MEKLTRYEEKLSEAVEEWGKNAVLIFRGQENYKWKLESSAERRLEKPNQEGAPNLIEYLNKALIEPARNEGHAHQQNKELNNLELLAALQHQGAATCLIDATDNFHIALWFACQDDSNDGKVFIINRGNILTFKEVTPKQAKKDIKKLLKNQAVTDKKGSYEGQITIDKPIEDSYPIYYWKPPPNENRIVAQQSCFIFSARPIKESAYKEIRISKGDKKEIRELLQKYYGLEEQSIFRDFTGFAASHSQDRPINYKTSEQWLQSGNKYFRQEEYAAAVQYYDRAINLNPGFAEAYNNRGIAKAKLGQYEAAITDYDKAINLNPRFAEAYLNRGSTKGNLEQHEAAVTDFDMGINLNQEDAIAYHNRGVTKAKLGQYEAAITDYDIAINLNQEDATAYYNRGSAKDKLGQYGVAITDYDKAINLNPRFAEAYNNRGSVKDKLGQYEVAITDYDKTISLNPEYAVAYYNRGITKVKLEQYEAAITDYDKAIDLNPGFAKAYLNRGVVKYKLEQYEAAVANFDMGINLDPEDAIAYYNRGLVKGLLQQYPAAIEDIRRAQTLAQEQGLTELLRLTQKKLNDLKPYDTDP